MFPGESNKQTRSKILETLEKEGLFDKADWPKEMETVKDVVVGKIKTWLDSKPTGAVQGEQLYFVKIKQRQSLSRRVK